MSIQFNLTDFNCLVTGGTKGIGNATLKLLCQSQAKVYTCSRHRKDIDDLIQTNTKKGHKLYGTTCDIIKAKDRENLVEDVNEKFGGKLDILVNNVGTVVMKRTVDHTDEDYRNVMETDVEANFKLTKMIYPMLKASDKGGSIVFVSSVSGGPRTTNVSPVLSMANAALNQLSAHLACEWAKDNIRVNCVSAGFIKTPLADQFIKKKEIYDAAINSLPMKRIGETSEIAYAIVFLSSPASSFTTGSTLIVDGGYSHDGIAFDIHS